MAQTPKYGRPFCIWRGKTLVGNITDTVFTTDRGAVNIRLGNDWNNCAVNQVPFVIQFYRNHRFDIQHIQHLVIRAGIEVGIVLKRHADEIRDRVLRFLG